MNEETIVPEAQVTDEIVTDEVEVVEAEADAEPEDTETDDGEAQATTEAEPSESSPEKKDGTQKRIDELTRLRRTEQREKEYWKNLAQQERVAPGPVELGKTLADFDYDEGKFAEYVTAQAAETAKAEVARLSEQEKAAQAQAEFSGREADYSKDIDDYHAAVTNPMLQFSQDMAEATLHAEKGPELRYYLAKNPEVSARLSNMPMRDMARELGIIEATKLVKETPSVTKAPKPVPKLKATDNKVTQDPSKMSDAQFRKWREKQIANR